MHAKPSWAAGLIFSWVAVVPGCGGRAASPPDTSAEILKADPEATQNIQANLNRIINDASKRYAPIQYQYDEDLLAFIDRFESLASGRPIEAEGGGATPLLPGLDEAERLAHVREVIRLWESKTGRDLRQTIDTLKAEVASHQPGEGFHPDFHRRFASAFDEFYRIHDLDLLDRRNRAIHAEAEALFDQYRSSHPDLALYFRKMIDLPEYAITTGSDAPAADNHGNKGS